MAQDLTQPHDNLFRAVFGDPAEAAGLLRAHLPAAVANGVQWSTLSVEDSAFVAPDLSATESDLLYSIRRRPDGAPAWLYVLVEHLRWSWLVGQVEGQNKVYSGGCATPRSLRLRMRR